jgi:hypothetical protein
MQLARAISLRCCKMDENETASSRDRAARGWAPRGGTVPKRPVQSAWDYWPLVVIIASLLAAALWCLTLLYGAYRFLEWLLG